MAEIIPVAFYPNKPSGSFLEVVKETKASIGTELLIKPVKAVPGTPAKIIAVGETPHWVCDHVFVEAGDRKKLEDALQWALGLKDDTSPMSVVHQLREVFGPEVEELTDGEQV